MLREDQTNITQIPRHPPERQSSSLLLARGEQHPLAWRKLNSLHFSEDHAMTFGGRYLIGRCLSFSRATSGLQGNNQGQVSAQSEHRSTIPASGGNSSLAKRIISKTWLIMCSRNQESSGRKVSWGNLTKGRKNKGCIRGSLWTYSLIHDPKSMS